MDSVRIPCFVESESLKNMIEIVHFYDHLIHISTYIFIYNFLIRKKLLRKQFSFIQSSDWDLHAQENKIKTHDSEYASLKNQLK